MNKKRILMDLVLATALGFCMAYTFTGGLIHEILGMLLLVGMLVHMFRRCSYYSSARRTMHKRNVPARFKALYTTNVVMIFATVIMLFSSVFISKELFAFADFSWLPISNGVLRIIHVACGIILLLCAFVHVCLHSKMFTALIKKAVKSNAFVTCWKVFSKVVAAALAILLVKVSYDTAATSAEVFASDLKRQQMLAQADIISKTAVSSAEKAETEEMPPSIEGEGSPVDSEETAQEETSNTYEEPTQVETVDLTPYTSPAYEAETEEITENYDAEDSEEYYYEEETYDYSEEETYYSDDADYEEYYEEEYVEPDNYEPDVPTLSDYLSWFTCSGCGKHCSLLSPGCGKGESQANNAANEYYAIYA